ncbi:methyl-accepting chemotaxis protein, partial [bacterium]|nr:methyl-accepting chemotaxis protein [bacterium]
MKKFIEMVRSKFLWKYSLINLALVLLFNLIQWGILWWVFADQIAGSADFLRDMLIVTAALVLLGVAFMAIFVAVGRHFISPLDRVVDSVKAACQGDIGHKVEVDSIDEFGVLAKSYNQMLDLIVYLIRQTQESSRRLAQASSEILSATEQQASGAAEQAASISETTA